MSRRAPTALTLLQRPQGGNYKARAIARGASRIEQDARRIARSRNDAALPTPLRAGVSLLPRATNDRAPRKVPPDRRTTVSVSLEMTVNGKPVRADVDPRTLLVDFLRNDLALTGTHVGCDTAQCGACTVHLDGEAVKSCNVLAVQANGANVVTIEGLAAEDGTMHPMQTA